LGKDENNADVAKFRDYFDYAEPIRSVPSHRALAVFRGRALELLDAKLLLAGGARTRQADGRPKAASPCTWAGARRRAPADDLIRKTWPGPGRSS
jgi:uncharacterized protein